MAENIVNRARFEYGLSEWLVLRFASCSVAEIASAAMIRRGLRQFLSSMCISFVHVVHRDNEAHLAAISRE
jgi:hypothetical protein